MMNGLAVGIGGFLGAMSRYMVSALFPIMNGFPFATLLVNVIGCFLLAFLLTATTLTWSPKVKLAVTTGFLGAFTTFSTFSLEAWQFLRQGALSLAFIYMFCSIVFGLFASAFGFYVAKGGFRR